MKKTQAVNLTHKVFAFKTDNFTEHDGFRFYSWKSRELCRVLGVLELEPGDPHLCVGVGDQLFDFEHIPLSDVESVIDMSRDFSTELATADRPQGVVVNIKEFPAGTNHAVS